MWQARPFPAQPPCRAQSTPRTGLQTGGGTIFEKEVTAGFIESGDTTFNKPVVTDLNSGIYGGVAFQADLFGSAATAATRFLAGSSLTSAGALQIQYGAVSFSGGATGTVNHPDVPVFLGLPGTTAVFLTGGITDAINPQNSALAGSLGLSDSGTQFTVNGDLIVGVGGAFSDPTQGRTPTPATVSISSGAKLITNGKTFFGMSFPNDPDQPNGQGTLTVDGTGSKWVAQGDILVGAASPQPRGPNVPPGPPVAATGEITVSNGGSLDATGQKIVLGEAMGSEGTLNVRNANSTAMSQDITVGSLGTGTLVVEGTAMLHNAGNAIVGEESGSSGTATISGMGTKWQVDGELVVGLAGDANNKAVGHVTVSNGAELSVAEFITLGQETGSQGTLTLDGVGSKYDGGATLEIGRHGDGTFEVKNGASATLSSLTLGVLSDGSGTILVDGKGPNGGPASTVTIEGSLTIGGASAGTLSVTNGGQMITDQGAAIVGRDQNVTGKVTLSGLGSQWTITAAGSAIGSPVPGTLTVGQSGTGTFAISDQAKFIAGSVVLGQNATGNGTISLTGSGGTNDSAMTAASLTVGDAGTGTLNVSSGGKLKSVGPAIVGNQDGSMGTVTLDGAGTSWTLPTGDLTIGKSGTGELDATNSASITTNADVTLGDQATHRGTVVLDSKATWQANGSQFIVGNDGTGNLTVKNGASLMATRLVLGEGAGFGQVNVFGDGATLKTTDQLSVGTSGGGRGLLSVSAGGQVTSVVSGMVVRGGSSSVFVNGTGTDSTPSTLTVSSLAIEAAMPQIDVASNGVFKVNGGDINMTSGVSSNAIFTVESGGQFLAPASAFNVGPASGSIALKVISGGTLNTGTATVNGSNTAITIGQAGDTVSSSWNLKAGNGQTGDLTVDTKATVDILDNGHIDAAGTFRVGGNANVVVNGMAASLTGDSGMIIQGGVT